MKRWVPYWEVRSWFYGKYFGSIADFCIYVARRSLLMKGEWADDREVARRAVLYAERVSGNLVSTEKAIEERLEVHGDRWSIRWREYVETDPLPPVRCKCCGAVDGVKREYFAGGEYSLQFYWDVECCGRCAHKHRALARRMDASAETARMIRVLRKDLMGRLKNGVDKEVADH